MSLLEIVLAAVAALLAVGLLVTSILLAVARRRVKALRRRLVEQGRARPRLTIPTASQAVRGVVGTAIRVKDHGFSGALRGSIADIARWADVERPDLVRLAGTDGIVTILFSDIQDSTALNDRLGDRGWVRLLARHDKVVTRATSRHGGHVIKSQGDGFMIAFGSADEAVAAALDLQDGMDAARGSLAGVRVRVGAHTGSAVQRDGDLFGRNVAYAARVAALADGGDVLVSDDTWSRLEDVEVESVETQEVELKGLAGTHRVHRVVRPAA